MNNKQKESFNEALSGDSVYYKEYMSQKSSGKKSLAGFRVFLSERDIYQKARFCNCHNTLIDNVLSFDFLSEIILCAATGKVLKQDETHLSFIIT